MFLSLRFVLDVSRGTSLEIQLQETVSKPEQWTIGARELDHGSCYGMPVEMEMGRRRRDLIVGLGQSTNQLVTVVAT